MCAWRSHYLQQFSPVLQVPDRQPPVFRGGNVLGVDVRRVAYVLLLDSFHLLIKVGLLPLQHTDLPCVPAWHRSMSVLPVGKTVLFKVLS